MAVKVAALPEASRLSFSLHQPNKTSAKGSQSTKVFAKEIALFV